MELRKNIAEMTIRISEKLWRLLGPKDTSNVCQDMPILPGPPDYSPFTVQKNEMHTDSKRSAGAQRKIGSGLDMK